MATRVVVIGAGWFGLVAAKTYLQVDPSIDLIILESEDTLGGTWSRSRVYPTLLAQQPYGRYEYSDMSIGEISNEFTPATLLHTYMNEYAERFGILQHIRFNTTASRILRNKDGKKWDIWINDGPEVLTCERLIVATGFTSLPIIPDIPNKQFTPQVFHTKELGKKYKSLISPEVANVTVYGGGKSAIDCVYSCVAAGKHVNWVIWKDGSGMPQLLYGRVNGRVLDDFSGTRIASKLHPNLQEDDWWHWLLHSGKSFLGQWAHWKYWERKSKSMQSDEYTKSENMAKLTPKVLDHGAYWVNATPAVITQPEIMDWIHKGELITIYRESITHLEGDRVHLSNGESHQTDTLVLATGYSLNHPWFSPEDCAYLGLPTRLESPPSGLQSKWDILESKADKEVIARFPRLASPPTLKIHPAKYSPYRLWRNIVPLPMLGKESPDRSLAFVGLVKTFSTAITSEAMAIWTVAWMTGRITPKKTIQELEYEVAIANAFSRRRYLNLGYKYPYQLFEFLPVADELLEESGVKSRRKSGTFAELFEPYLPRDYRGLVEEFKAAHGIGSGHQK